MLGSDAKPGGADARSGTWAKEGVRSMGVLLLTLLTVCGCAKKDEVEETGGEGGAGETWEL